MLREWPVPEPPANASAGEDEPEYRVVLGTTAHVSEELLDRIEEALAQRGIPISNQTGLARLGLDWEEEQRAMVEEEEARHQAAMVAEQEEMAAAQGGQLGPVWIDDHGRMSAERAQTGQYPPGMSEERVRRIAQASDLVTQLQRYECPTEMIARVLLGDALAAQDAITHVRHVLLDLGPQFQPENPWGSIYELLRSDVPGSQEALMFMRGWTSSTVREEPRRAQLAEEADRLWQQARREDPESCRRLLRGLGLPEPPPVLGQPVHASEAAPPRPTVEEAIVESRQTVGRLKLHVRQTMGLYDGDIYFTLSQVLHGMREFATSRGFDTVVTDARLRDALRDLADNIDNGGGLEVISESNDGETNDICRTDTGPSGVHERQSGQPDDAVRRTRPGLLDL